MSLKRKRSVSVERTPVDVRPCHGPVHPARAVFKPNAIALGFCCLLAPLFCLETVMRNG